MEQDGAVGLLWELIQHVMTKGVAGVFCAGGRHRHLEIKVSCVFGIVLFQGLSIK